MKTSPTTALLNEYGEELVQDAAAFLTTHLQARTVTKGPFVTNTCQCLSTHDLYLIWAERYQPDQPEAVWNLVDSEGAALILEAAKEAEHA